MKTKLLIYGITGDLSKRKLLPALTQIVESGAVEDLRIIGVSRRQVDVAELLKESLGSTDLAHLIDIFSMDLANGEGYGRLKEYISLQKDEQLIVYLSVPPAAATDIVDFMGEAGINGTNVKLLFEKPFGVDLSSAHNVIERTARYFKESQIYRIDHYLAKEMAQNIVAIHGGNALFMHVWNSQAIERIEVVALEKIGIEGRAEFYEQTGALRDVLQGHLMQLLALTLMEIPSDFDWDQLPRLRYEALRDIVVADGSQAVRAQYDGYQEEVKNPGSLTETFISLVLSSRNSRWKGVPLVLTTGKAMHEKMTEVRIHFRKFHEAQSNCLTFRIQPDEGLRVDLFTKKPGYERKFETRELKFSYAADVSLPDAYEQVLVDAIRSRKSLFASSEEVLRSWEILQPVQQLWSMDNRPLGTYPRGSSPDALVA